MTSVTITTRAATGSNEGHSKTFNLIKAFAARDPTMPLGAILVLLYLFENRGLDQGVNLKDLRKDLGMTATIASRSI